MISFKISGLDENLNGLHTYQQNSLKIASNSGHLHIDKLATNDFLRLSISPDAKSLEAQSFEFFSTLYQKNITHCLVKFGDRIFLHDFNLEIINFRITAYPKFKEVLNQQVDDLLKKDESLVSLLKKIKTSRS